MPKRSTEFQKLVFVLKKQVSDPAKVTESKMLKDVITGKEREVDVCIETEIGGHDVMISIECVEQTRKADITWVEQMKSKHERLPTNALVLVSKTGLSADAIKLADASGIETLSLKAVDEKTAERLFGKLESLWNKTVHLSPLKVLVHVARTGDLEPETVNALPDNNVYLTDGTLIGPLQDLVDSMLNTEAVRKEFLLLGGETHKSFSLDWESVSDLGGNPLCLQKENPKTLRTLERIRIIGKCQFEVSKFPLEHGMLGHFRITWGKGQFAGKEALLVASEDKAGDKRLSITITS